MLQTSSTDEIFSKEPKEYGPTSLRCQYGSDGVGAKIREYSCSLELWN